MAQRDRHVLTGTMLAAAVGATLTASVATAESARVLSPVTPTEACPTCEPLKSPDGESEPELSQWSRKLEATIREAAQDLGLTVDDAGGPAPGDDVSEHALVQSARDAWVFSPRVDLAGKHLRVRIVAVAPKSAVVLSRTEIVVPSELEVRAAVMMRDLVRVGQPRARPVAEPRRPKSEKIVAHAEHSRGRAVLAMNTAALGGYVGYSLQRASGSDDARLTYPLIALGTGVGLGGSMIVADEWDVGLGDAWYLSAGMWWPTLSALFLANGFDEPQDNIFLYSLAGAATGLTLATVSLTFGGMSDGGAVLTHSGGALGTTFGGLAELLYEGKTNVTPSRGMGFGSGLGVLAAGTVARLVPMPSPSRLLLVDLSAALGGLTGAAIASPLVFGDRETETKNRLWLGSVGLGLVVGAGVGILLTSSSEDSATSDASPIPPLPYVSVAQGPRGASPVFGLAGQW